tara:strand:+ start:847 stop:1041 length:195 start_codon:yes stop_codon:yes gene_type:complete
MKIAICFDECGTEVSLEVENLGDIPEEYKFRYFQEHSERELAEWRLDMQDDQDDHHDYDRNEFY